MHIVVRGPREERLAIQEACRLLTELGHSVLPPPEQRGQRLDPARVGEDLAVEIVHADAVVFIEDGEGGRSAWVAGEADFAQCANRPILRLHSADLQTSKWRLRGEVIQLLKSIKPQTLPLSVLGPTVAADSERRKRVEEIARDVSTFDGSARKAIDTLMSGATSAEKAAMQEILAAAQGAHHQRAMYIGECGMGTPFAAGDWEADAVEQIREMVSDLGRNEVRQRHDSSDRALAAVLAGPFWRQSFLAGAVAIQGGEATASQAITDFRLMADSRQRERIDALVQEKGLEGAYAHIRDCALDSDTAMREEYREKLCGPSQIGG